MRGIRHKTRFKSNWGIGLVGRLREMVWEKRRRGVQEREGSQVAEEDPGDGFVDQEEKVHEADQKEYHRGV